LGRGLAEDLGCCFALGFGVRGGGWFVFEDVGQTGGSEGAGFGFDDGAARIGDFFECVDGVFERF
tara:strand:+ start:301 stop:495 length:195 start_codon:yes stop_codon:yes gene_type:complete